VPALDGIRGMAIIAVLFVHSYSLIDGRLPRTLYAAIYRVASVGAFGVDLFFVLSGFLITGILLDARSSPHYFRNFYARRFLRLFPVYYTYLIVVALVLPRVHGLFQTSMGDYSGGWWWYILYFCNWKPNHAVGDPYLGHFWSLAVEEQFYLVWPAIVLLLRARWLAWLCVGLALGSIGLRFVWAEQNVYWNVLYRLTVTRFDTLALGALAALAVRSPKWAALSEKCAATITVGGLVAFAIVATVSGGCAWERKPVQTIGAFFAAVCFAGLVLLAVQRRSGPLHRFLTARFLTSCGKYSYGMYVYHIVIFAHVLWAGTWVTRRFSSPSFVSLSAILTVVVSNIVVFAFSRFSYKHFEKPILAYKDRFSDGKARAMSSA